MLPVETVTLPSAFVREDESGNDTSMPSTVASNTAAAVATLLHAVADEAQLQASAVSGDATASGASRSRGVHLMAG
jgi:hypothetical protein